LTNSPGLSSLNVGITIVDVAHRNRLMRNVRGHITSLHTFA